LYNDATTTVVDRAKYTTYIQQDKFTTTPATKPPPIQPTKVAAKKHISLITIMFCFNEFAFTVQVKHKINGTQIIGFILICLYFKTDHFHTYTLQRM